MFGCNKKNSKHFHVKEYVALRVDVAMCCDVTHTTHCRYYTNVPKAGHTRARWICNDCGEMGIDTKEIGEWKIEHGKLLPDKKAWASWEEAEKK